MDTIQTQIVNGTVPYRLADAGSRALTLGGARPATADR